MYTVYYPPPTKQRVVGGVESGANIRSPPHDYLHNLSAIFQQYPRDIASLRRERERERRGWNFEMLIFVSILLSLERRKKFNLGSLGGREEGESLSLGGRKKKNVLTISRLIYRRASRCVSTREERERRVVF